MPPLDSDFAASAVSQGAAIIVGFRRPNSKFIMSLNENVPRTVSLMVKADCPAGSDCSPIIARGALLDTPHYAQSDFCNTYAIDVSPALNRPDKHPIQIFNLCEGEDLRKFANNIYVGQAFLLYENIKRFLSDIGGVIQAGRLIYIPRSTSSSDGTLDVSIQVMDKYNPARCINVIKSDFQTGGCIPRAHFDSLLVGVSKRLMDSAYSSALAAVDAACARRMPSVTDQTLLEVLRSGNEKAVCTLELRSMLARMKDEEEEVAGWMDDDGEDGDEDEVGGEGKKSECEDEGEKSMSEEEESVSEDASPSGASPAASSDPGQAAAAVEPTVAAKRPKLI